MEHVAEQVAAPARVLLRAVNAVVFRRDPLSGDLTFLAASGDQTFADHAALALENARFQEEKLALAHEEARRRLTYDLHDGIAQLIVGAKQHLDTCLDVWSADPGRAGPRT